MRRIEDTDRIVIIGGGISGLSSAFYLQREAERQGRSVQLTIVDGAESLGGKINTLQRDGFVIEKGPDSFLSRKLAMYDLAKELGIEGELTRTNPNATKTYILYQNKLHPMPAGLVLGVPTNLEAFMETELISEEGKQRALQDLDMPARQETGDESIGSFLERRLGPECTAVISEALLAGIYAGDLKHLSLQATFPQFAEAEVKHGSLIRGMQAGRTVSTPLPPEAKGGLFMTFTGGLSTMVKALDQALSTVERRLGSPVKAVEKTDANDCRYEVLLDNGERLPADYVIMTAPAFVAADLLEPLVDVHELRGIDYVSVANVVMAFDKETLGIQFDGTGFVIPSIEGTTITASTWTSTKWVHTSPDDKVLLRCYVGRAGDEAGAFLPDDELEAAVRADVESTMGITAKPLFTEITRLHHSMPQYPVGHLDHIRTLRDRLQKELPGVWVTGAAFDGVGLPDCIRQGKEAAEVILAQIEESLQ